MRVLLVVLIVVGCGCPSRHVFPRLVQPRAAGPLLITDVAVFDGVNEALLEHRDVLTRGDRIERIAPHGELGCDECAKLDGTGKTLIPGLVDSHVHLTGSPAPPWHVSWPDEAHNGAALLASGVTTAFDVGGDAAEIAAVAKAQREGRWLGPEFRYAGTLITPRGGYPASMVRELFPWPVSAMVEGRFALQVGTPEEARAAVEHNLAAGASYIKVAVAQVPLEAPAFDAALLHEVVAAAHARGVKVVAHIDTAAHALLAARTGVDALVHGVHLGPLSVEQAAELARLGTVVAPTLVVWDRVEQLAEHRFAPTALEQALYPEDFLRHFRPDETTKHSLPGGLMRWIAKLQASKRERFEAVKRLWEAGVPLLVGADDAGSVGCMTGAGFHEELRLLREAGVPMLDVLRGATSEAARFWGGDFGVVREGARADLLLLDGNPLADDAALGRVSTIIRAGVVLDRVPLSGT
ncbi:MAG: amidohydrolase family protein [Myxococcota bacterium]